MSTTSTIVLGSGNVHKGVEMRQIMEPLGISLLTLSDFPKMPEVLEDGQSFEENAVKKASGYAQALGKWVIAEDSGLSVLALDGAPGIYSARFSGEHGTDQSNNALLLSRLDGVPWEKRQAFYTCFMVLADPAGSVAFRTEGRCFGRIKFDQEGHNGFGYDPLFEVLEYHQSFGVLAPAIKKAISHRARATRQMISFLLNNRDRIRD